ncbi:peptidoglycan recognition protein [Oncorhynchus tshawytscha]|uniref:peptidoglycan recognition protein n=1 Tax=Oncorhynchus tshawytscha TaxID=74940 RepID=UPI001C3E2561|nr:peptidoglycan recognition protein [Oncorhynchus tshawytscha]
MDSIIHGRKSHCRGGYSGTVGSSSPSMPGDPQVSCSKSCHTPHGTALWGHQLIHIQRMHMQDRNFDDIGYNFLIGGDCTVYEGRGWGVVGTHTKGNNHNSLAIAFMGNFNNESPSPAAKSSVKQLLQCGVSQGHFHPVFILLGHRDLRDTECPGERLYAALKHLKFP